MNGAQDDNIANKYKNDVWFEFASKLLSLEYESFLDIEIKLTENNFAEPKILTLALLSRTISNFEGVIALTKQGLVVEARILTRSCYENMFYIGGLIEKGEEFISQMFGDEIISRLERGKLVLELKQGRNKSFDEFGKDLPERIKDMKKRWPKAKFLNPSDAAKSSVLKNAYLAYRQLSADAAHPSLRALHRHMEQSKENNKRMILNVKPANSPIELVHTVNLACIALMGACVGVNQILERSNLSQQMSELNEEYLTLVRDLDVAISEFAKSGP